MKKMVDDTRLIFKCCSLYYQDHKGQQEICDILGISRPTVSRMLKQGRERGVVKIEITNPENVAYGQLERKLEQLFGLQEVIVVQSSPLEMGRQHISSALGSATLDFLSRVLSDEDYVGVSMGMTIQNVTRADYIIEEPVHCTFVPILGGVGESRLDIHSNYLVRDFAELFGAKCIQFFAPAIFSDKAVLTKKKKEQSIKKIFDLYRKLDIVLMGIGILESANSTVLQMGYVDKNILEEFLKKGAVGDVALQYFNVHGETKDFEEFNERVAGMPLEEIKNVPRRVGISGGRQKVEAVMGAIQGGFVNILITDVDCAEGLIELAAKMR